MDEMIMMKEEEYNELIDDLGYWIAAAMMLSARLEDNGLPYSITEEEVAKFKSNREEELM
jgi:hypothetical protein